MQAVLDRPGPPVAPAGPTDEAEYRCDCSGFKELCVEKMCLRCLEAYSGGLPAVLQGAALEHEMRRVAGRLATILQDDPLMANLPVEVAFRVAR